MTSTYTFDFTASGDLTINELNMMRAALARTAEMIFTDVGDPNAPVVTMGRIQI